MDVQTKQPLMAADDVGKRLTWWLLTMAAGAACGAAGGALLGEALYRFSYDYIVVPGELLTWGLRVGSLTGALIAATQVMGPLPPASIGRAALGLSVAALLAALGCLLGAGLGHLAWRAGIPQLPHWKLPNPHRHAMFLGVMVGKDVGVAVGVVLGGVVVFSPRTSQRFGWKPWSAVSAVAVTALLSLVGWRLFAQLAATPN
jgi:hypothetical protein